MSSGARWLEEPAFSNIEIQITIFHGTQVKCHEATMIRSDLDLYIDVLPLDVTLSHILRKGGIIIF